MVLVFALDTSTAACSAALRSDGKTLAKRFEWMERGHAEALMPMVEDVMAEAEAAPGALDLIAVTVGPGTFTGLRIGLAAARSLALATGIPCIGLTTTETLAQSLTDGTADETVVAVLDSKRADIYTQSFSANDVALDEPTALAADQLPSHLADVSKKIGSCALVGDAQQTVGPMLTDAGWTARETQVISPDAEVLASLAEARWNPGENLAPPAPLYLRPADAVIPKNGGRLRS